MTILDQVDDEPSSGVFSLARKDENGSPENYECHPSLVAKNGLLIVNCLDYYENSGRFNVIFNEIYKIEVECLQATFKTFPLPKNLKSATISSISIQGLSEVRAIFRLSIVEEAAFQNGVRTELQMAEDYFDRNNKFRKIMVTSSMLMDLQGNSEFWSLWLYYGFFWFFSGERDLH